LKHVTLVIKIWLPYSHTKGLEWSKCLNLAGHIDAFCINVARFLGSMKTTVNFNVIFCPTGQVRYKLHLIYHTSIDSLKD